MIWNARRQTVVLLVGLTFAASIASCDGRTALNDADGAAGATAGTSGGAGTGATAGTHGGGAGTGAAAGTGGGAGAGTSGSFAGTTGAAGTNVFDAGVADRPPVAQDAGPPLDGATGTCSDLITTPPAGTFSSLSAGNSATCGLRPDGIVACWGLREYSSLPFLNGRYKDVSLQISACGVHVTGELECSDSAPLPGTFEQVVSSEAGGCARRADLTVACWGGAYAPPSKFDTLTGGAYYMCGLESGTHRIACWEPRTGAESLTLIGGPFKELDTGRFFACGLLTDGSVKCWDPTKMQLGMSQSPPGAGFHGLSVGEFHACALRDDGQATCWGQQVYPEMFPPAGIIFKSIAPGSYHTCGILPDDTVRCWGRAPFCTG